MICRLLFPNWESYFKSDTRSYPTANSAFSSAMPHRDTPIIRELYQRPIKRRLV